MDYPARVALVTQCFNDGRLAEAEAACLELLEHFPHDANGLYFIARIYEKNRRVDLAIDVLTRAVARHQGAPQLHNCLGELLLNQNRLDEADAALRTAIRLKPDFVEAHYNLGRIQGAARLGLRHVDVDVALRGRQTLGQPDPVIFSCFQEQEIARRILAQIPGLTEYCIDIGGGDGTGYSNSYALFRLGWRGAIFEAGTVRFTRLAAALEGFGDRVNALRGFATPKNIGALLGALGAPAEPGFLTLDIDSYDYDVLAATLAAVRPAVICAEINERVHPGVDFALHYHEDRVSPLAGQLMSGVSIGMIAKLFDAHGYGVVGLEYNNVFAVQRRHIPALSGVREMSAEEAWRAGFFERPDWRSKMPWNVEYLDWFNGDADRCRAMIRRRLAAFAGDFTLA